VRRYFRDVSFTGFIPGADAKVVWRDSADSLDVAVGSALVFRWGGGATGFFVGVLTALLPW
jgi:hypothetical protein